MDLERSILSKVVLDKDFASCADLGVNRDMFYDQRSRAVWDAIKDDVSTHGQVPSRDFLKREFPTYKFYDEVEDPLGLLVDALKENHALTIFEQALVEASNAFQTEDLAKIKSILTTALSEVDQDLAATRDINLVGTGQDRWDRYDEMQNRDPDEYLGIPMGFPVIDNATQGFQNGQLVVFVGPPKAGKSTIMILAARAAHKQRKKVLVIGFEMSNEEQYTRYDAIEAGIDHAVLRGGKDRRLTERQWRDLDDHLREMDESGVDFILSNDTHNNTTLTGVAAKIDKYKPDLVIIDGVYMMTDEVTGEVNTPQALTNITRGSKRLAQNKEIPVVITTQVLEWKMDKKKGVTSSSIGYSSSFGQDADVIVAVEKTERENINKIKIVLARNAQNVEVYCEWDWSTGTFEELSYNPFEETEESSAYESSF
jgi:replicative DNA helicase